MAPASNLREDGMFPDGTNPENVDPVPPLNWSSKEDLKDVVVHGLRASPAVDRLLCFLRFYNVPYTFKPGKGKKGDKYYKKMPVIDVAGRQVNDTFIILKNMVPALSGAFFHMEWESRITFEYQSSCLVWPTDAEAVKNFKGKGADLPLPGCLVGCILPRLRSGGLKALRARSEDPNDPIKIIDLTEFTKEFAAAMEGKQYFHGDEPGPVDVSFYGVNSRFVCFGVDTVVNALEAASLIPWFKRMEERIPLVGKPGALFEKL
mmetsp:Transcript_87166/g.202915  ORF Transcript_87166/g.202915 Transcript_87166/m.202915 type:complete len:262 (-) Transcript_87166:368-1153(-)